MLYSFPGGPEGAGPYGVTRDSTGNLYGVTAAGGGSTGAAGSGLVFELNSSGNYAVLYSFTGGSDGSGPGAAPLRDPAGNLYGTTVYGGTTDCSGGCGVVYRVNPSGQETVLYSFTGGADGSNPYAGLVADPTGNLYGTTPWGGKGGSGAVTFSGGGVVFEIKP
ncbi:MAG: choice-of-anchor tandem repeat GloVer-containing protein [Bryobacteraceae bacterium]